MRQIPTITAALASFALALPAAAGASPVKEYGPLKHPRREDCRLHYWKRTKAFRGHQRVFCVYVPPKPTTIALPSKPVVTPAATVKLHAHLDPSFVQNPTNPLAVTYSFSASATEEGVDFAQAAPSLPAGVLSLYSDGLLECSVDVGGSSTGGECPVTYTSTGAHTVIVTYTSATSSTSETVIEHIQPYATSTGVTETVASLPFSEGLWTITTSVTGQTGYAVSGIVEYVITDRTTGLVPTRDTLPTGTTCEITESHDVGSGALTFSGGEDGTTGNCGFREFTVPDTDYITIIASFAGAPGFLGSSSVAVQI